MRDAHSSVLKRAAKTFLALANGPFGRKPLGLIEHRADHAARTPVIVATDISAIEHCCI